MYFDYTLGSKTKHIAYFACMPTCVCEKQGKAKGKGKGKNKATDVKKENMKRAAEASKKDEQSGEVQVGRTRSERRVQP